MGDMPEVNEPSYDFARASEILRANDEHRRRKAVEKPPARGGGRAAAKREATMKADEKKPREARGRPTNDQPTGDTLADRFARHLRAARSALGWTLDQASQATEGFVGVSDWSRYEGGAEPRLSAIFAICTALGLTFEQLISGVLPRPAKKGRRTA